MVTEHTQMNKDLVALASEEVAMPQIMKPMWLTRVKESRRLMSSCATAPRMPTSMVSRAAHISTVS